MKLRKTLTILLSSLLINMPVFADVRYSVVEQGQIYTGTVESDIEGEMVLNRDQLVHYNQHETGKYSDVNCGPTCLSMVATYFGKEVSAERLNAFIEPHTQGYSYLEILEMLKYCEIGYKVGNFATVPTKSIITSRLVSLLRENSILFLAIDTSQINMNSVLGENTFSAKVGRTYNGDFNHYILCTGYLEFGEDIYFQIIDPMESPEDGVRYYKAKELSEAILGNWNGYIAFHK